MTCWLPDSGNPSPLLDVHDLSVCITRDEGVVRPLNGVSFRINTGQAVGIVGESGCGKTMTSNPAKALDDAQHIAISAVHGIDYLLTWNYRHLDNAETKPIMRRVCLLHDHTCPEICTPQELMGGFEDV